MGLLNWILPGSSDANLTKLAHKVARLSHDMVWQRIASRAGSLASLPEARGYIRTRASCVVRRQLARSAQLDTALSASAEERIVQQALALIADRLAGGMIIAQPALAPQRRAA